MGHTVRTPSAARPFSFAESEAGTDLGFKCVQRKTYIVIILYSYTTILYNYKLFLKCHTVTVGAEYRIKRQQ